MKHIIPLLILTNLLRVGLTATAADGDLLLLGSVSEFTEVSTGDSSVFQTTNTYDGHGELAQTVAASYSSSGHLDFGSVTTYSYGKHRILLFAVQESSVAPGWRAVITYTNLSLDVQQEIKAVDWDGNGTVDYTEITTTTLNRDGTLHSVSSELDGLQITSKNESVWTYDFPHHQYVIDTSSYANGLLRSTAKATATLDHRRNPISLIQTVDIDADGIADFRIASKISYDKFGNVIETVSTNSFAGGSLSVTHFFYARRAQVMRAARSP